MKEIGIRAATGAVYVALTLGAAWAGPFTTFLLFLPVSLLAVREMHLLYWGVESGPPMAWTLLMAATMHISMSMGLFDEGWTVSYSIAVGFLLLLVSVAFTLLGNDPAPARTFGGLLTLLLLIVLPFGLLVDFFTFGAWSFVGFMILLWTNDTGAYLVGRAIGRTKLLPAVSPKKTVEGFVGGLALTIGMAWGIAQFVPELEPLQWVTLGGIITFTSTLGDLLESAFKRERGVKDSGTLLPGHGGILDRFDGFFLAVPSVLLYLHLIH